ncbi:MAG: beta-ketoacyl-ACP synthase III [Raineya sp.]|nr:ketoacyl-ACP synthase III [Raineya sp.]MDW8296265.1 beta-ketoacyl-ACP synthase III [Raineya sp.]
MYYSKITGLGYYVPENVVTNFDLEKLMDTSNEWIIERSGIQERRFFTEGKDTTATMAAEASKIALERAGLQAQDIDLIVFATLSPDYNFPGSGVLLQRMLPFREIGSIDVRAQCSGFIYGLSIADQYIKTGMYQNVLVVGSEIQSNILELSTRNRNFAVLFGDGAGAVVLQATTNPESRILSTHLHSQGQYAEELMLEHPGGRLKQRIWATMVEEGKHLPYMQGQTVFKHAVQRFPEVIREALQANGYTEADLDLVVPHQANLRITKYIQQAMNLPDEKIVSNIHKYGNTTAASIPIALCEAFEEGRIKKGDLICLAAFGSGFTWASALIRW